MSDVRVADLRAKLCQHLRNVRAGRSITVLHRNTPIVRIVPYDEEDASLTVRHPLPGAPSLKHISLPPPLKLRRDIVAMLLEERQGDW